jgi:hypothetical protein
MEQTKRTWAQAVRSIPEITVNIGMSHKSVGHNYQPKGGR